MKDIRLDDQAGLTSAWRRGAEHAQHQECRLLCALCCRSALDRASPIRNCLWGLHLPRRCRSKDPLTYRCNCAEQSSCCNVHGRRHCLVQKPTAFRTTRLAPLRNKHKAIYSRPPGVRRSGSCQFQRLQGSIPASCIRLASCILARIVSLSLTLFFLGLNCR